MLHEKSSRNDDQIQLEKLMAIDYKLPCFILKYYDKDKHVGIYEFKMASEAKPGNMKQYVGVSKISTKN